MHSLVDKENKENVRRWEYESVNISLKIDILPIFNFKSYPQESHLPGKYLCMPLRSIILIRLSNSFGHSVMFLLKSFATNGCCQPCFLCFSLTLFFSVNHGSSLTINIQTNRFTV